MGHSTESAWNYEHGDSAEFSYSGLEHRIWLCTMEHCAESLTTVRNHTNFIEKPAASLKGRVRQKLYMYKLHYPCQSHPMIETPTSLENKLFCVVGHCAECDSNLDI